MDYGTFNPKCTEYLDRNFIPGQSAEKRAYAQCIAQNAKKIVVLLGRAKNSDGLAITEHDLKSNISQEKYPDRMFEIIIDDETSKLEWFVGFTQSGEFNYSNWQENFIRRNWPIGVWHTFKREENIKPEIQAKTENDLKNIVNQGDVLSNFELEVLELFYKSAECFKGSQLISQLYLEVKDMKGEQVKNNEKILAIHTKNADVVKIKESSQQLEISKKEYYKNMMDWAKSSASTEASKSVARMWYQYIDDNFSGKLVDSWVEQELETHKYLCPYEEK